MFLIASVKQDKTKNSPSTHCIGALNFQCPTPAVCFLKSFLAPSGAQGVTISVRRSTPNSVLHKVSAATDISQKPFFVLFILFKVLDNL